MSFDLITALHRAHKRVEVAVKDKRFAERECNKAKVEIREARDALARAIRGKKIRIAEGVGTVIAVSDITFQLDNYEFYTYEQILEVL